MKYRVELDVSFETEENAISLLNLIEEYVKPISFKPVGDEQIPLIRHCRFHKCYHDEVPCQPCGEYTNVDFDGIKMDYKTVEGIKIESSKILEKVVVVKEIVK